MYRGPQPHPGVVVDLDEVRSPKYDGRHSTRERHVNSGAQRLRPGIYGTEGSRCPVGVPDEIGRDTLTGRP